MKIIETGPREIGFVLWGRCQNLLDDPRTFDFSFLRMRTKYAKNMTFAIGKFKSVSFNLPFDATPTSWLKMQFGQRNVTTYIRKICKGHPWSRRGQNTVLQAKEGIKHLINFNRFAKWSYK